MHLRANSSQIEMPRQKPRGRKSPKTTEGTPESVYIDIITILRTKPGFEYSERNMAVVTPIGITATIQRTVSNMVPTITGKIPPFVMPSVGDWVINSQLRTLMPLYATKNSMINRVIAPAKPNVLIRERKNPCFRLNLFLRVKMKWFHVCFLSLVSYFLPDSDSTVSFRDEIRNQT